MPNRFRLVVRIVTTDKGFERDSTAWKRLDILRQLFRECEKIVVATDAGREGELIFRYIYEYLKCQKPFERLWISSLTDRAIRGGSDDLFYVFETPPSATGTTVYAVLKGIYDLDGDAGTTADRYPVDYRIPVSGMGESNSIARNGYYRIAVTLSDLSGEPADIVVSVCPWQTPEDQNYGLGQEETRKGQIRQIEHFARSFPVPEIECEIPEKRSR